MAFSRIPGPLGIRGSLPGVIGLSSKMVPAFAVGPRPPSLGLLATTLGIPGSGRGWSPLGSDLVQVVAASASEAGHRRLPVMTLADARYAAERIAGHAELSRKLCIDNHLSHAQLPVWLAGELYRGELKLLRKITSHVSTPAATEPQPQARPAPAPAPKPQLPGNLKVRVLRFDTNAEVTEPCSIFSVTGPESLSWDQSASTTFTDILSGDYKVSATVPESLYEPLEPAQAVSATVPAGGTGNAVIRVTPKTWIRVKVYDKDAEKHVPQLKFHLQPSGVDHLDGVTDEDGASHFPLARKHTSCDLHSLESDDDELYEVVEVLSS